MRGRLPADPRVKLLFVHQNFPGQFLHIARHLADAGTHEILFISEPNQNTLPGVRKAIYRPSRPASRSTHGNIRDLDAAMVRADAVAKTAGQFKGLGFTPDIIIGHHGWGELLSLPDLWPGVPLLGYFEFFYRTSGLDVGFDPEFPTPVTQFPQVRAKNAVNLLALALDQAGQTPTRFQRDTYPAWARPQIRLIPEGANLDLCKPNPAARRKICRIADISVSSRETLITYVARGLEPYRGFHVLMRAIPAILARHKNLRIAIVGADEPSYGPTPPGGSWRRVLAAELGAGIDPDRVHFLGRVDYDTFRALLQRSDLHLYLTYPFVASWSLREALAMGCAVLGSDTAPVREFITHGHNGLLVRFPDPAALADAVHAALEDRNRLEALRANARAGAEAALDMAQHIEAFSAEIARLTGQPL